MLINFDNALLKSNEILERVSEKEIYEYYLQDIIKEGRLYKCPFHKDKDPSLGFKLMPSTVLIHRCFGCGARGNVFTFVGRLLNLSFWDTIKQINRDFNFSTAEPVSSQIITKKESIGFSTESHTKIFPVLQNFSIVDFEYWNSYGIPLSLLLEYNISACKQVFVKTKENNLVLFAEYSKKNPIYCYKIDDTYKIYRPLNPSKVGKWLSTTKQEDIQGMKQLPLIKLGKLLIITSSMKDLLVLKILGYDAIALGGEGNRIPAKILDYLYASFEEILIFYDNDEAGIKYAQKLSEEIKAGYVYIPLEYKDTKDISDFIKKYDKKQAGCLIKQLINGWREYKSREGVYITEKGRNAIQ